MAFQGRPYDEVFSDLDEINNTISPLEDKIACQEVRLQASRALNDELRAENTRLREACEIAVRQIAKYMDFGERPCPFCEHHHIHSSLCAYIELNVALAAASPKLSCTRCECLIFKVELYDEADQPLCRDCYQELYAERDRAEEKWEWADIRIDRRRET